MSNHLGNILAVINDRKKKNSLLGTEFYEPTIISAQDYFPFGQEMGSDRSFSASSAYRYGFNGKEKDSDGEWGSNTHYDYGFRIYNPAIAKFLSVDPLTKEYPWYTPYQIAGNKPIYAIDLDGLEESPAIESGMNWKVASKLATSESEQAGIYRQLQHGPSANRVNLYIVSKNRDKSNGDTDWALQGSFVQAKYLSGISVLEVESLSDALGQVKNITDKGYEIGNVIIDSHGSYSDASFNIGKTKITEGTGNKLTQFGNLLSDDSKICLLACHAGGGENDSNSSSLLINLSKTTNTTVYGSKSWTGVALPFLGVNPSQKNPRREEGEQPNADANIGKWKKSAKRTSSVTELNSLRISPSGGIFEGSEVSDEQN